MRSPLPEGGGLSESQLGRYAVFADRAAVRSLEGESVMVIVSHPAGTRYLRAILAGLHARQMLQMFATTIAIDPSSVALGFLPAKIRGELVKRTYTEIPSQLIRSRWFRELIRILEARARGSAKDCRISVDSVFENLDDWVANSLPVWTQPNTQAVLATEGAALRTFQVARGLGLTCAYDLPIAYWETTRRLLEEERQRYPHWEATLTGALDPAVKLQRKVQEIQAADTIICPSRFVASSIPERIGVGKRIEIIPFGAPRPGGGGLRRARNGPLRVLFVGSLSQRKGLADLFEAVRMFSPGAVELVVAGPLLVPLEFYRKEAPPFTYVPPCSNREILDLMRTCDVFVLPSIVEGRAQVVSEAMSQGLPVIVTENTGTTDLVIDDRTGFVVPVRSPEAIAAKIERFLYEGELSTKLGQAALEAVAQWTYDDYGSAIAKALGAIGK